MIEMTRIFKKHEYSSIEAMVNAVHSWINNTKEFDKTRDFHIIIKGLKDYELEKKQP
jgi:hypothetical protein